MNTDACLDFSVMAYQAWEITYGSCGAGASILVRLSGPVAKSHDAAEVTPSQRGKVGFCPCCVASHACGKPDLLPPWPLR